MGLEAQLKTNYLLFADMMIGETYTIDAVEYDTMQTRALKAVKAQFDSYSLTTDQMGAILSEMAIQTAVQFNKDALTAAVSAVQEDTKLALSTKQGVLVDRQTEGFNDNLIVKMAEFQANLASFAVNAGSTTAQSTIDLLKDNLTELSSRANLKEIFVEVVDINSTNVKLNIVGVPDGYNVKIWNTTTGIDSAVQQYGELAVTVYNLVSATEYKFRAQLYESDGTTVDLSSFSNIVTVTTL